MDEVKEKWDALALAAQSGDKLAYHALLSALIPYIRKIIAPGLTNPDWVDDLLQDILMGVHKSLARYMPGQPFRPWVNAIIRYRRAEFLSQHYASMGHKKVPLDEVVEKGVDLLGFFQTLEDIERVLQQLPEKQQQIFYLVRIEGMSIREVAKQMAMSESAIKVSAHRSAAKLKEILQQV